METKAKGNESWNPELLLKPLRQTYMQVADRLLDGKELSLSERTALQDFRWQMTLIEAGYRTGTWKGNGEQIEKQTEEGEA